MEGSTITDLLAVNLSSLKNKPDLQSKLKEFQDALKLLHDEMKKPVEPNDQLTNILSRISSLESKEESNARQIRSLTTENTSLKKRIDELENHLDDAESRGLLKSKNGSPVSSSTQERRTSKSPVSQLNFSTRN